MTHRTRYFLFGSGLIVIVGLCTGLVAYYNGALPVRAATALDDLAYVAPDVTAVAYADVRQIMDSEFRQRLRALMPIGQEKDKFLAETGIDIEKDIDTVLAGLNSDITPASPPLVLVRGRFIDSQIEAAATQQGATVETYRGKKLLAAPGAWRGESGQTGSGPGVAFLEPGLIALGSVDAIRRAIDAAEAKTGAASNVDLMRSVQRVRDGGDAWIVGRASSLASQANLPPQVRDQLASMQWFALTADVDRALVCRFRAEAKDVESGEQMRAIVNGALAMAKMMAGKDARYDGVLNSIQSTGSGQELEVSFTVPPEMLDLIASADGPKAAIPNSIQ